MTLLAAGSGPPAYLPQVAGLLVAAAAIGYLCVRLRIVPIVGFLLAGVLIGPDALGVVTEREVIDAAGEVGVILLLFTIGIEFSIERLTRIRRLVLLGGTVQVVGAVGLVTGLLVAFDVPVRAAVFTGFLVALSSTALVLKLLADRGATSSPTGQAGVGLLIFQDLAVVVMVLLVPVLAGGEGGSTGAVVQALGTAVLVIAVTLVVARRLMPPLLEAVARACSPEVFLLTVIALCLGTAYLTALAGVSVSLGAFLAGLVVSESRHSAHALGEVLPLQVLFSAVFFLSVGTLLDVRFLLEEPLLVLGAVVLVLVLKTLTTTVAALAVGVPLGTSLSVGLLLAQVGEFAFVLQRVGADNGLTPADLGDRGSQAFLAATVVLLVATPGLAAGGRKVAGVLDRRPGAVAPVAPPPVEEQAGHVLVSGWGSGAQAVVAALRPDEPAVLVTLNPDGASEAEVAGLQVVLGDSTKELVLREAGVTTARLVVVADDEPEQAARIVLAVRRLAPATPVVVRAPGVEALTDLAEAGADRVVLEDREGRRGLADAVAAEVRPAPRPTRTVADTTRVVTFRPDPESACAHTGVVRPVLATEPGCVECRRDGQGWVHLRLCATCGHVGCCDGSPGRHAEAHAAQAEHPVMLSIEPGDDWGWCYLDAAALAPEPVVRA